MATLAELLINAEIDPALFAEDVRFIAQDKLSYSVYGYTAPPICNFTDELHYAYEAEDCYYSKYAGEDHINLEQLASDWTVPLSIESYTAAWNAAHNVNVKEEGNVMCEDVEFPVKMEYIGEGNGSFVVLFTDYTEGQVISSQNEFRSVGEWDNVWTSCNVPTAWKPYVEEVKAEWPKIMQAVYEGDESYLIVEFTSEQEGTVIDSNVGLSKGHFSKHWVSCADAEEWKPYVEATQTPSAALPDIPATLTAQDIVKRLEELKMGLNDLEASINEKNDEYSTKWAEYQDLKDQLLELI